LHCKPDFEQVMSRFEAWWQCEIIDRPPVTIDVYRRAQDAGKCMQLICEDTDHALAVAEYLKPEGVWFRPGGLYSPDEVEAFIRHIARWAARGGGRP
jgi:hypothetical protein